jgi:hypothetical protein
LIPKSSLKPCPIPCSSSTTTTTAILFCDRLINLSFSLLSPRRKPNLGTSHTHTPGATFLTFLLSRTLIGARFNSQTRTGGGEFLRRRHTPRDSVIVVVLSLYAILPIGMFFA